MEFWFLVCKVTMAAIIRYLENLTQGPGYSPWDQIQPAIDYYKFLLRHRNSFLFTYCFLLLLSYTIRFESFHRDLTGSKS